MTPQEAIDARMSRQAYSRLDHGSQHYDRMEEFDALKLRERTEKIANPDSLFTWRDAAILLAALREHCRNIGHRTEKIDLVLKAMERP